MPCPRRTARSCFTVAMMICALGCSSPEERFNEHMARAGTYVQEGRTDDALIELQSALKIDPADPDLNAKLAELLKQRGSMQAAAFHFGEAYRLDPSRVEAALEQASLLWPSAPRRAEQILAGLKQRFPDDARVVRGEAQIAALMKDMDGALAAAKRAVELAPEDPDNWALLGASYLERTRDARRRGEEADLADYDGGVAAFEKLDELTEGHVGARVEKARLLGNRGDHEGAVAAFRSAIELAKQQENAGGVVFAAQRMAGYADRAGDPKLQVEALRELVAASPESVRQWDALSRVVEAQEGREAAEAVFQELLEKQPESIAAHLTYTNFLLRSRRPLDAIAHIDRMIGSGLDAPVVWEQLVRLELGQQRVADARVTVEEMKDRHPDHDATRRSEVRLALQEKRYDDALEVLQEFAGEKESAETELMRATAHQGLGNLAAAAAAAERSATLAPRGDVTALHLEAAIHADARDWRAVLQTIEQITAKGRTPSPNERVLEARSYYELGEPERGRELLDRVLSRKLMLPAAAVEFARREGAKQPAEARAYLTQALGRVPGNHDALEEITKIDLAAGRDAVALQRLDRLVESQIAGPRVLLLRSQILLRAGELDRAEADALRAFEAVPELSEAVDMLFTIYSAQNKLEEARRSFEEADSVGVLHKGARVLLARLDMALGDKEKARALYEKVLAEDDRMVAAQLDLARLLASDEVELDRALSLAEQAQRAEPDEPAIADTVGHIYLLKGRHEVALQQFRMALALADAANIEPPAVHYHLGLALAALGRNEEARASFERALEIDPKFGSADDARDRLDAIRTAARKDGSSS